MIKKTDVIVCLTCRVFKRELISNDSVLQFVAAQQGLAIYQYYSVIS